MEDRWPPHSSPAAWTASNPADGRPNSTGSYTSITRSSSPWSRNASTTRALAQNVKFCQPSNGWMSVPPCHGVVANPT